MKRGAMLHGSDASRPIPYLLRHDRKYQLHKNVKNLSLQLHKSVGLPCDIRDIIYQMAERQQKDDKHNQNVSFIKRLQLAIKTKIREDPNKVCYF